MGAQQSGGNSITPRKVFLITGFNNWGKTTLLSNLFATRVFQMRVPQYLPSFGQCGFLVMPQSNDDLGEPRYINAFNNRLNVFQSANGNAKYIASAFCPTREPANNSINILNTLYRTDQIEMLLIEDKWCGHAKLQIHNITSFYSSMTNITFHTVSSTNALLRLNAVRNIFASNLP